MRELEKPYKIPYTAPTSLWRGTDKELLWDTYEKTRIRYYFDGIYWRNCPMLSEVTPGISITPELVKIAEWANSNLYTQLDLLTNKTVDVYTRIIVSRLNKLEYIHGKSYNMKMFDNLIASVKWLRTEYIVTNMKHPKDDLPF